MGDARFERPYEDLRAAADRSQLLRQLSDEDVVQALAAASRERDPLLANVLATEASNRMRRLRAALAYMGEGVVALGPHMEVHWMNPAAERLLRLPRLAAMAQPFESLVEHLDSARDRIAPERCAIIRALDGHAGRAEGEWFITSAGELCVSYIAAPILAPDGSIEGAVVAFRDHGAALQHERELRASRERYKSLFDLIPEAIISVDLQGNVLEANAAAERITDRPIAMAKGRPFREFLHPDDVEHVTLMFYDISAGAVRTARLRVRHVDGRYVEVEATGIPVRSDGDVVGIHGVMRVIEDRATRSGNREDPSPGP